MDALGGKHALTLALALAACAVAATPAAAAGPYNVNSTLDTPDALLDGTCDAGAGVCTLRAAIQEANNDVASDAITFAAAQFNGDDTISVTGSALPAITESVTISCATDPGGGQPCVEIDANNFAGVVVNADATTVSDIAVTEANQVGVQVNGTVTNTQIDGFQLLHTWTGLNLDGTGAVAEANTTGVFLDPAVLAAQIGNATPGGRNVIANSNSIGLLITGADTTSIRGNYFGTNPAGTAVAGNGVDIKIGGPNPTSFALATTIGGLLSSPEQASAACDGPCNLISGAVTGIDLDDTAPHNGGTAADTVDIFGNYIGLNQDGSAALTPLGQFGIEVGDADNIAVGQGQAQGLNLFGGFSTAVRLFSQGGNLVVERNLIGTTPTGGPSPTTVPVFGVHVIGELGNPEASAPSIIDNTISATGVGINDELRDNGNYRDNSIGVGAGNVALPLGTGIQVRSTEEATIALNTIGNASGDAVSLIAANATGIRGNTIGPTAALGNGGFGINLQPFLGTLPTTDTEIGGDDTNSQNSIANNADGAVAVVGADSNGNQVMRNTGSANGGLFIDLGDDGPGATTGANNDIQPPQLTSVTASAVSGTGAVGATVRLFSKSVAANGEIQAFFGEATVAGDGTWSVAPGPSSPFVGATQTIEDDGTSEMAVGTLPVEPPPPPPPPPAAGDLQAPETTITKAPKKKSKKRKAKFEFSSNEPGSTFECSLDGKPFAPCTSPLKTKKLKRKKHTFAVRATDAAGNTDASPAEAKFKVKKKPKKK